MTQTKDKKISVLPYLEKIEESAEVYFATYLCGKKPPSNRISYIGAINKLGERIYSKKWTTREFFAHKASHQIERFKEKGKDTEHKQYRLFRNDEQENDARHRLDSIEIDILQPLLASGEIESFYINHYTGEQTKIKPSTWSGLRIFIYGRHPNPNKKDIRNVPGTDFLILLDKKQFNSLLDQQSPRVFTISAENKAKNWLEDQMREHQSPPYNKDHYKEEVKNLYDIGTKAFRRAWANAINKTGNTNWSKPGRKRKS